MSLFSDLLHQLDPTQLFDFVLGKFPALRKLFDLAQKVIKHFTGTLDAGISLFHSVESEISEFKNFREDFRFRQRVVNVERAITKVTELIQGAFAAGRSVVDLFKTITTKLELGGAAEVAEAATGIGLPIAVVNAIVIIVEVLDTIRNVIDDLQTIVDEITRLRKAIETADTIFLPQSNARKVLTLDDGTKIKIRVGKLHS
jgi:hypothetical protein